MGNVSGGTAPYSYLWSNGETTDDVANLTAGIYTITVTDDNNCVSSLSDTIGEPEGVLLSHTQVDVHPPECERAKLLQARLLYHLMRTHSYYRRLQLWYKSRRLDWLHHQLFPH